MLGTPKMSTNSLQQCSKFIPSICSVLAKQMSTVLGNRRASYPHGYSHLWNKYGASAMLSKTSEFEEFKDREVTLEHRNSSSMFVNPFICQGSSPPVVANKHACVQANKQRYCQVLRTNVYKHPLYAFGQLISMCPCVCSPAVLDIPSSTCSMATMLINHVVKTSGRERR